MSLPKRPAAGGVVFDEAGRVLLIEPRNHYAGYVWTFPKGRLDAGEASDAAALREVREEAGVTARIVESEQGVKLRVGTYEGDVTRTTYFLMRMLSTGEPFDAETQAIRWASPASARALIEQTHSPLGRARDQQVLTDALTLRSLIGES